MEEETIRLIKIFGFTAVALSPIIFMVIDSSFRLYRMIVKGETDI